MFCKYCGKEIPDGVVFCSRCGKQIAVQNSKKSETENKSNSELKVSEPQSVKLANTTIFESKNENLPHYVPTDSSKSRLAAALLAFFLGEFGAHRFYVGKTGSAFFQLILGLSFFIGLICAAMDGIELAVVFFIAGIVWSFWVLVDFIIILCGSFKDKEGLPLTDWGL